VTFAWEPVAPVPGERRSEDQTPARVAVTAMAVDGRPLFRGRVPEEAPSGVSADGGGVPAAAMAGSQVSFEVPPGEIKLRLVVEGPRGQALDSATREMTVPDFTTPQVSIATPEVFRAKTARDIQNIKAASGRPPTADRSFTRTDRLFIRATAYAPGNTTPTMAARLLNRNGDGMSDIPVRTPAPGAMEIDFPLSNLAPGDYLIELSAKAGQGAAQTLVAFKVGR
jgi:hypothetical protein